MKNGGKRLLLALILLAAALMLSGCVSGVEIEGASRDSAPTSGTLVLHVEPNYNKDEILDAQLKSGSTITLEKTEAPQIEAKLKNLEIKKDDTNKTIDIYASYSDLKPGKYQIKRENNSQYIEGLSLSVKRQALSGAEPRWEERQVGFRSFEELPSYEITIVAATPKPTAVPDTSKLPKTGDGSSPALWLIVCLGCAAAVALLLRKRSRR